jgi:LuxR family maltose regulon positive regulatory protein
MMPDISETITRERLFGLQDEVLKKRLTSIVAAAGYGKTTLIAQTIRNSSFKYVWYRLDSSDRDLVTFISYLVPN